MSISLGVVTDEVSQDPREALRWAREHQLDYVDLRDVHGRNVADLSPGEVDELQSLVAAAGLPVRTICPQLFRAGLQGDDVRRLLVDPERMILDGSEYAGHLRLLQRSLDLARRFGAPYVRTFAFWRQEDPAEVLDLLAAAFRLPVRLAAAAGKVLLLENEAFTCAMSGGEAAALIAAVDSPHLAAIWDPANAFHHPEAPFPTGYQAVGRFTREVHAKDATAAGFTVPGRGQLDWPGQLAALARDGFGGGITVEPRHAPPGGTPVDASAATLVYLRAHLEGGAGS